jgi:molybdopterin-guanine dinucleotide biosynthesis protein A
VNEELFLLILAGGKSERMGKDKALIDYTGKPHIYFLIELLSPFTNRILISRNKEQTFLTSGNYEIIYDDDGSENQGPLTGLISAIKKYPTANFLTVYCDIINIDKQFVQKLINERNTDKHATCFIINDFPEPSIVIFENKSNRIILDKYNSGKYSIIKFLKEYDCKKIALTNPLIDKDE